MLTDDERDKIRGMHAALYGGAFEVGDVAGLYALKYQMLVDFLRHKNVKNNLEGLREWIITLIESYGITSVADAIEQAIDEGRATDTKYVESLLEEGAKTMLTVKDLPPDMRRKIGAKAKASKYHSESCVYTFPDGSEKRFDSRKECERFAELLFLRKVGQISNLETQVKYELIPAQKRSDGKTERACSYVADFVYVDKDGKTVVEDVKGYRDPSSAAYAKFVIKRKLMLQKYGITVKEV